VVTGTINALVYLFEAIMSKLDNKKVSQVAEVRVGACCILELIFFKFTILFLIRTLNIEVKALRHSCPNMA
jgi:hypothetical protein